jgi:DNA-binding transcriptional LysR family regulator
MELRHLRYFVVVAEEQNVTRAAERLHVSQPPLSRQIRDLEEELGVALFQRTAKSLALTEAGKLFLGEARAILFQVDKAVEAVRVAARGERGRLRIGYAPSLTVGLLPRALRTFERECPGVRVALLDLSSEECLRRLAEKKIDLALTVEPTGRRKHGLVFEEVVRHPVCCAVGAGHPLARRRSLSLGQLRQERFMIYSRDEYPEYFEWMEGFFQAHRFKPVAVEEYDSATGLIAAVEAGRGVAIVPASLRSLAGPGVKLLPLTPKVVPLKVGALAVRPVSPLAARFIAALKDAAGD